MTNCIWNVECFTNEKLTETEIQEIICSKIANILINEENEKRTLVN